ncbi:Uncharacterised protein [Streptococcus pneumoniae]|nr:Uncharacterised protein [Streptococcus pneumoniae]CJC71643.1 Uncharacterised protein [Streptococcus pneumoniae]CJJ95102.1 Uncharacterised protein [Streptococcus pneumoniae]COS47818.1 Uncharacterised protein [Streptococcus pneumoniae]
MKKSDGNNEGNVPSYTLKKKPSTKIPANIAAICPLPISKNAGIANTVKPSKPICTTRLLPILSLNLPKYSASGIISAIVIEIINKPVVSSTLST